MQLDDPECRRGRQHGIDGWVLEDMEWDPDTGIAIFEYSSITGNANAYEMRIQPTREGHANWELLRDAPTETLTMR